MIDWLNSPGWFESERVEESDQGGNKREKSLWVWNNEDIWEEKRRDGGRSCLAWEKAQPEEWRAKVKEFRLLQSFTDNLSQDGVWTRCWWPEAFLQPTSAYFPQTRLCGINWTFPPLPHTILPPPWSPHHPSPPPIWAATKEMRGHVTVLHFAQNSAAYGGIFTQTRSPCLHMKWMEWYQIKPNIINTSCSGCSRNEEEVLSDITETKPELFSTTWDQG